MFGKAGFAPSEEMRCLMIADLSAYVGNLMPSAGIDSIGFLIFLGNNCVQSSDEPNATIHRRY